MDGRGASADDVLRAVGVRRLLVLAPNWLGDAVMALPALADVRRGSAAADIVVAARPSVAALFSMVPGVSQVIAGELRGASWRAASKDASGFDAALVLRNSFHSALLPWRMGIRERWGYAGDGRSPLLTRAISRPSGVHQARYYQQLTEALGFPPGPLVSAVHVGGDQRAAATRVLQDAGWNGTTPLLAVAPGAAYGGAKRWPARSFAAVASALARDGATPVIVGSAADGAAGRDLADSLGTGGVASFNLVGRTDLTTLCGVFALSRGLVSNDSGAMHLAAAVGVPVVAVFGPTDETATHPIGRAPHAVLTHDVWCRPCMLRECPLDHACMTRVAPDAVISAVRRIA